MFNFCYVFLAGWKRRKLAQREEMHH
jgi:hypothetical protein